MTTSSGTDKPIVDAPGVGSGSSNRDRVTTLVRRRVYTSSTRRTRRRQYASPNLYTRGRFTTPDIYSNLRITGFDSSTFWAGFDAKVAHVFEPMKVSWDFGEAVKLPASVFEPIKLHADAFGSIGYWPILQTTIPLSPALNTMFAVGAFIFSPSWTLPATAGDALLSSLEIMNTTTFDVSRAIEIQRQVEEAFVEAADEEFEEGVRSSFAGTLASLIVLFGNDTMKAVEQLLDSPAIDPEVAGEALRQIGAVKHNDSKKYRRVILEQQLRSPSPRRRYSAALGLAAMDDPGSISALEQATILEQDSRLRKYLSVVLEQLQDTERCLSS